MSTASNRFKSWAALLIFSAIALTAHAISYSSASKAMDNWILSATAISLGFSFIACLSFFLTPEKFAGKAPEAGFSVLLVIIWLAALPIIMDPQYRMAVTRGKDTEKENIVVISNSNLYFSSWACFLLTLYITGSVASNYGASVKASRITTEWYGLSAVSLVVMISAVRFFQGNCENDGAGEDTCRRTDLAIAVGATGFVVAGIFSLLSTCDKATLPQTLGGSFFLFALYAVGVGFTTFGHGPASFLGNLYFFMWGGFILTILLFGECVIRMFLSSGEAGFVEGEEATSGGEVETVESGV